MVQIPCILSLYGEPRFRQQNIRFLRATGVINKTRTRRRTAPECTCFIRLAVFSRFAASERRKNIWLPVFKRRPADVMSQGIRHSFGKRCTAEQWRASLC